MTYEASGEFNEEQSERSALLFERLADYPDLYERYYDHLIEDRTHSTAVWCIINLRDIEAKSIIARGRANEILGWDQQSR